MISLECPDEGQHAQMSTRTASAMSIEYDLRLLQNLRERERERERER